MRTVEEILNTAPFVAVRKDNKVMEIVVNADDIQQIQNDAYQQALKDAAAKLPFHPPTEFDYGQNKPCDCKTCMELYEVENAILSLPLPNQIK